MQKKFINEYFENMKSKSYITSSRAWWRTKEEHDACHKSIANSRLVETKNLRSAATTATTARRSKALILRNTSRKELQTTRTRLPFSALQREQERGETNELTRQHAKSRYLRALVAVSVLLVVLALVVVALAQRRLFQQRVTYSIVCRLWYDVL